jgi:hypothetical protein
MHCILLSVEHCSGDIAVIQVLRNKGVKWDVQTPAFAAAAGHLHVVQVSELCYCILLSASLLVYCIG